MNRGLDPGAIVDWPKGCFATLSNCALRESISVGYPGEHLLRTTNQSHSKTVFIGALLMPFHMLLLRHPHWSLLLILPWFRHS